MHKAGYNFFILSRADPLPLEHKISEQVIDVEDYSPEKQGQSEVKVERPETPPPFLVVATAHANSNTPNRIDSPTVLGRSPLIGLDESSDHEIDNIETIHLDESNENEEIEERFRPCLREYFTRNLTRNFTRAHS